MQIKIMLDSGQEIHPDVEEWIAIQLQLTKTKLERLY